MLEDPGADEATAARSVLSVIMGMPVEGDGRLRRRRRPAGLRPRPTPARSPAPGRRPRERPPRPRDRSRPSCGRPSTRPGTAGTASAATAPPSAHLSWVRERAALVNGIADSTMTHDEAWQFLALGRCLERADMTARLSPPAACRTAERPWSTVLRAAVRSRRSCAPTAACSATTGPPRSSCSTGSSRARCSSRCPRPSAGSRPSTRAPTGSGVPDEARRRLGRIRTELEYRPPPTSWPTCPRRCSGVQGAVHGRSDAIARRYFQAGTVRPGPRRGDRRAALAHRPHDLDRLRRPGDRVVQRAADDPAHRARPDHAREPAPDPADDRGATSTATTGAPT